MFPLPEVLILQRPNIFINMKTTIENDYISNSKFCDEAQNLNFINSQHNKLVNLW
jgi:hypothetical protein